jgi:hypothetical protein
MRLPTISKRLNVSYRKVHNKRALASPPAIAVDAAGELLSIPFDLDEWLLAALTVHTLIPYSLISSVIWLPVCAVSRKVPLLPPLPSRSAVHANFHVADNNLLCSFPGIDGRPVCEPVIFVTAVFANVDPVMSSSCCPPEPLSFDASGTPSDGFLVSARATP